MPWRRTLGSRLRHPGFPNWPPEFVLDIHPVESGGVSITHRDEWVPFEPGGESLWSSTYDGRRWRVRRVRFMDYEGGESARPIWPITLEDLPASIQRPESPGDWGTGCNFAVNLE